MNDSKSDVINEEIAAAIAIAVASMHVRAGRKLAVRSIRRIPQTTPIWSFASRIERLCMGPNS